MVTGLMTFLLWAALSACSFLIATGGAWLITLPPRKIFGARLVLMLIILIVWWICVPATAPAYSGKYADPQDANRHARWEARQSARLYGAHTIWAWCVVALLRRPKARRGHEGVTL